MKVLFDDPDIIILDKPAGLATANSPRGDNSLYVELINKFGDGCFVGVVSRLDKPVSGVVIFGKNKPAAACLAKQFRDRTVMKEYVAVVEKRFPSALGTWVTWRDHVRWNDTSRRAVVDRQEEHGHAPKKLEEVDGLSAETVARVIKRAGEVSLVELQPRTGRRHQLRVQLASRGCPIVGDRMYGSRLPLKSEDIMTIALHAQKLTFDHPSTGVRTTVEAEIPRFWKAQYNILFPQ